MKDRDDEIAAQIASDLEWTRRAQQLMTKVRTQGTAGRSSEDPVRDEDSTDHE